LNGEALLRRRRSLPSKSFSAARGCHAGHTSKVGWIFSLVQISRRGLHRALSTATVHHHATGQAGGVTAPSRRAFSPVKTFRHYCDPTPWWMPWIVVERQDLPAITDKAMSREAARQSRLHGPHVALVGSHCKASSPLFPMSDAVPVDEAAVLTGATNAN
jgi:hypothetical protein